MTHGLENELHTTSCYFFRPSIFQFGSFLSSPSSTTIDLNFRISLSLFIWIVLWSSCLVSMFKKKITWRDLWFQKKKSCGYLGIGLYWKIGEHKPTWFPLSFQSHFHLKFYNSFPIISHLKWFPGKPHFSLKFQNPSCIIFFENYFNGIWRVNHMTQHLIFSLLSYYSY